jgi:hypothetical protein
MNIDTLPLVPTFRQLPRTAPITMLVVHTNEGPEGPTTAEGLAAYLTHEHPPDNPGYHIVVDENSAVRLAPDGNRVNGAGGVNERSLHVCITGYAAQSAAQWHDVESLEAIAIASSVLKEWSRIHAIPLIRLAPSQIRNNIRGVCGHVDVSSVYPASQGHSDPGVNFPWTLLLSPSAPTAPEVPVMASAVVYRGRIDSFWVDADGDLQHNWGPATSTENMKNYLAPTDGTKYKDKPLTVLVNGTTLVCVAEAVDGRLMRWEYTTGWGCTPIPPK